MAGKNQSQSGRGGQAQAQMQASGAGKGAAQAEDTETGVPDSTYALISTTYHLLQGAETLTMFIEDAHEDGEEEVAEFLEETREEFIQRAARAKELLATCLEQEAGEEDDEEEEE